MSYGRICQASPALVKRFVAPSTSQLVGILAFIIVHHWSEVDRYIKILQVTLQTVTYVIEPGSTTLAALYRHVHKKCSGGKEYSLELRRAEQVACLEGSRCLLTRTSTDMP